MPSFAVLIYMCVLAISEALYAFMIIAHVYSFVPIHWNVPIPPGLEVERESYLYIVFLVLASIVMLAAHFLLKNKLMRLTHWRPWLCYLVMSVLWVVVFGFAYFKWLSYRYPFYQIIALENDRWVLPFFYGALALSLITKIFWPEFYKLMSMAYRRLLLVAPNPILSVLGRVAVCGAIALLIWPKYDGGLYFILINVVGFVAIFLFLDWWLRNFWIAVFGVFLAIKMNMFHYGLTPVCWAHQGWTWMEQFNILSWAKTTPLPMFHSLRVRQFFPFFLSYLIPLFYVFSLLTHLKRNLPVLWISIVGLVLYIKYILEPNIYAYGALIIPAIVLLCYWIDLCCRSFVSRHRKVVGFAFAVVAIFFLLTNRLFVAYPHVINMYGMDYTLKLNDDNKP